jgi:hypothetical protein
MVLGDIFHSSLILQRESFKEQWPPCGHSTYATRPLMQIPNNVRQRNHTRTANNYSISVCYFFASCLLSSRPTTTNLTSPDPRKPLHHCRATHRNETTSPLGNHGVVDWISSYARWVFKLKLTRSSIVRHCVDPCWLPSNQESSARKRRVPVPPTTNQSVSAISSAGKRPDVLWSSHVHIDQLADEATEPTDISLFLPGSRLSLPV